MENLFRPLSMSQQLEHLKLSILFALGCFFILSCGKNESETAPTDLSGAYYPLQIGKTLIYDVDSVIYDPQAANTVRIDTFKWQVKEVLSDTFRDALGVLNYKIDRYQRRRGDTSLFTFADVFSASLTDIGAIRDENNLRFIKIPHYFGEKTTWDGNIFCDQSIIIEVTGDRIGLFSKKWNYEILTIGKAETIGTKSFADVTTVRAQSDPNILTEKRYNLEKYARGIGLVYKEQHILDTQKLDASVAWEKKAERGYIVKQTIVSYQ